MNSLLIKAEVSPKAIVTVLWLTVFTLIVLGVISAMLLKYTSYTTALGLIPFFDMDAEQTVTAYATSLLMVVCVIMLLLIAQDRKRVQNSYWPHWLGLSVGFLVLSIDESVSIHEFLAKSIENYLGGTAPVNFTIAILGFSVVAFLSVVYFKFLRMLPTQIRIKFLLSGGIYVLGAFGAELAGGYIHEIFGWKSGFYVAETLVEESLELIGLVMFVQYLFFYITTTLSKDATVFQAVDNGNDVAMSRLVSK